MPEYLIKFKNPSVPMSQRTHADTRHTVAAGLDELRSWCETQVISFEVVNDNIGSPSAALVLISMAEDDYERVKEAGVSSLPMLKFIVPNEDGAFAAFDDRMAELGYTPQENTPPANND
tara:strand:+ start:753 stop:1109 length:357 start_codon:yes stop_codon:yes gene_type:complete